MFIDTAKALVRNDLADTVVRIGWEFNGEWMPWAAAKDPESFKSYFRRIVETMRSVPGQQFRFEWCPDYGTVLVTLAGGAGLTMAIGLIGAWPILGARPARALREL